MHKLNTEIADLFGEGVDAYKAPMLFKQCDALLRGGPGKWNTCLLMAIMIYKHLFPPIFFFFRNGKNCRDG